jgi:hypothetical protein
MGSPILLDATTTGPDRLFPLQVGPMKHQGVYVTGRTHWIQSRSLLQKFTGVNEVKSEVGQRKPQSNELK